MLKNTNISLLHSKFGRIGGQILVSIILQIEYIKGI